MAAKRSFENGPINQVSGIKANVLMLFAFIQKKLKVVYDINPSTVSHTKRSSDD